MSDIDDGGAAFPISHLSVTASTPEGWREILGMTLRDYFAAAALQGILANPIDVSPAIVVKASYEYADAMLAARKEGA